MHKTYGIIVSVVVCACLAVLSGCTSLFINVYDFSREKKADTNTPVPSGIHGVNMGKTYTERDTPPIRIDNLTYARLIREHRQKIVIVQTIIKTPKNDTPAPDASGATKQNDEEKFIKPYLRNLWFDKRVMGMRHAASGTGFICAKSANILLICTNAHIIEGGSEIIVITASNKEYRAVTLVEEHERDVAVLAIESEEELSPVTWGNSDNTAVGETAMAIGHPQDFFYSASRGIVSAKRLLLTIKDKPPLPFFQFDMTLNLGNSGSPIFNVGGEVIGVAEGIAKNGQGIAFAIPANDFQKILKSVPIQPRPVTPQ